MLLVLVFLLLLVVIAFSQCNSKKNVDTLLINGIIYTVDSSFSKAEAIAVKDGKIVATGGTADLQKAYTATETIDLQGKFLYPGFIDAHAHFYRYGLGLRTADLTGTTSWDDVLQRLINFKKEVSLAAGEWIIGRGWDQNDWEQKEFPINQKLNELFPDNPVLLTRVDGHAAVVNDLALSKSAVSSSTKLVGGEVILQNGNQPVCSLIMPLILYQKIFHLQLISKLKKG